MQSEEKSYAEWIAPLFAGWMKDPEGVPKIDIAGKDQDTRRKQAIILSIVGAVVRRLNTGDYHAHELYSSI